jgi:hypothetical protein
VFWLCVRCRRADRSLLGFATLSAGRAQLSTRYDYHRPARRCHRADRWLAWSVADARHAVDADIAGLRCAGDRSPSVSPLVIRLGLALSPPMDRPSRGPAWGGGDAESLGDRVLIDLAIGSTGYRFPLPSASLLHPMISRASERSYWRPSTASR